MKRPSPAPAGESGPSARPRAGARVVHHRAPVEGRLAHRQRPGVGVEARPHPVPDPGPKGFPHRDLHGSTAPRPGGAKDRSARAVEHQGEAGMPVSREPRDDPLPLDLRPGRPDGRDHGHRRALRAAGPHPRMGAEVGVLRARRPAPLEVRGDRHLLDAGSVRVRIAADHPDEAGLEGLLRAAAHLEFDGLAGAGREPVGVADEGDVVGGRHRGGTRPGAAGWRPILPAQTPRPPHPPRIASVAPAAGPADAPGRPRGRGDCRAEDRGGRTAGTGRPVGRPAGRVRGSPRSVRACRAPPAVRPDEARAARSRPPRARPGPPSCRSFRWW